MRMVLICTWLITSCVRLQHNLIEQRQNAYSRIRGQAEAMEMALRDLLEFVQAVKIGVYYRKHEASEALYLSGAINGLGISEPKENESDD